MTRSPIPIATKNNPTQRFGGVFAIQPTMAKMEPTRMKALGRSEVLLLIWTFHGWSLQMVVGAWWLLTSPFLP